MNLKMAPALRSIKLPPYDLNKSPKIFLANQLSQSGICICAMAERSINVQGLAYISAKFTLNALIPTSRIARDAG